MCNDSSHGARRWDWKDSDMPPDWETMALPPDSLLKHCKSLRAPCHVPLKR